MKKHLRISNFPNRYGEVTKIKKYLLLIVFLTIQVFTSQAQSTLFSTGFETQPLTVTTSFTSSGTIAIRNSDANSGTNSLEIPTSNGNQKVFTGSVIPTQINFRAGYFYNIEIWAKTTASNATLEIRKAASADHNTMMGAGSQVLLPSTAITSSYKRFSYSFIASTTESKYIGFSVDGEGNQKDLFLDDILITESAVSCSGLTAPSVNSPSTVCGLGSQVVISATPSANANNCKWYSAAIGGSLLYTGTTYSKPALTYASSTIYVASYNSSTGCESSTRTAVTFTPAKNIQLEPTVSNSTVCSGYATTIQANALKDVSYIKTVNQLIWDGNRNITSTISVAGLKPALVTNKSLAAVRISIDHARVSDLTLTLTSPGGTVIPLTTAKGNGANFTNTVFTDNASSGIVSGTAPFTDFYLPETAFSSLNSGNLNGDWVLTVADGSKTSSGTLLNWELVLRAEATGLNYSWTSDPVGFTASVSSASVNPATATTYRVVVSDPASSCAAVSGSVAVAVSSDVTWLGNSTDWYASNNWSPCSPVATSNVIVPAGLANYPVLSSGVVEINDLEIETGATVTVDDDTLKINGTLINDGLLTGSNGTVVLEGNVNYEINNAEFYNLTIRGNGNNILKNNIRIKNKLKMVRGILETGANTIELDANAVLEESEDSYVTGSISVKRDINGMGNFNFGQIGITITPNSTTVLPGVTTITRTTGDVQNGAGKTTSILRAFQIAADTDVGFDVNMTINYLPHELNGLNPSSLAMFRSTDNGVTWMEAGVSQNTISKNEVELFNITGFSKWTLGDMYSPLPVELVSFTAKQQKEAAVLEWITANEKDNAGFAIESSANGVEFMQIGYVKSKVSNSTTAQKYSFTDPGFNFAATKYYRLKQTDLDGSFTYSKVVAVQGQKITEVSVFPNPVKDNFNITLNSVTDQHVMLTIADLQGKFVYTEALKLAKGAQVIPVNMKENLSAGTYIIRIQTETTTDHFKLSVQK